MFDSKDDRRLRIQNGILARGMIRLFVQVEKAKVTDIKTKTETVFLENKYKGSIVKKEHPVLLSFQGHICPLESKISRKSKDWGFSWKTTDC